MEWEPIKSAPFGQDLQLAVVENGEAHALVFPCLRVVGGWVDSAGRKRVEVYPTHWRVWRDC